MTGPLRNKAEELEAQDYAAAIRATDWITPNWRAKNADIIDRFSMTAFVRIKMRAWQIIQSGADR